MASEIRGFCSCHTHTHTRAPRRCEETKREKFECGWTVTKTQPPLVLVECAHNLIYARCFLLLYFYNEQTRADRRHDVCYWSNKLFFFLFSSLHAVLRLLWKFDFATKSFSIKQATRSLLCVPNCHHRCSNLDGWRPPYRVRARATGRYECVTTYFVQVFFRVFYFISFSVSLAEFVLLLFDNLIKIWSEIKFEQTWYEHLFTHSSYMHATRICVDLWRPIKMFEIKLKYWNAIDRPIEFI